jgi:hypothetical protein
VIVEEHGCIILLLFSIYLDILKPDECKFSQCIKLKLFRNITVTADLNGAR